MPFTLTTITEPVDEPVELPEVKRHLAITIDTDDSVIAAIMVAVRDYLQTVLHLQFNTATLRYNLDCFPGNTVIALPRPPLQSVTSIIYRDASNAAITLATSEYGVDTYSMPGRIYLLPGHRWPSTYAIPNAVEILYLAGWTSAAAIPKRISQIFMLIVGDLYQYRRATSVEDFIQETPYLKRMLWSAKNINVA